MLLLAAPIFGHVCRGYSCWVSFSAMRFRWIRFQRYLPVAHDSCSPWKHLLARRGYVELVPAVCILNQMVLGQICLAQINHRKNPETDTHP